MGLSFMKMQINIADVSIFERFKSCIFCILLFGLMILSASCGGKSGAKPKVLDSLDLTLKPDQISHNFEVSFVDSNWVKAKLTAGRGRIYQAAFETLIDQKLRLDLYSKNSGNVATWLTADSARIDDRTHDMLAKGHIVVYSDSSQTKLETSVLQWNQAEQKFFSTAFVRINSPQELIEGYGFESDQYLLNYRIFKVSGIKR